jgi:hypothetical protein
MVDLPDVAKTEVAIIELTNAFRRSERLADVKPNALLTQAARQFAEYLARTDRFAHEADGRQPADRVRAAGYKFCITSENLALNLDSRGFTTRDLAAKAVEGWKNSPGHRKNMTEPDVVEIGVGIARAPSGPPKFISVQLFGRPESLQYRFQIENRSSLAVRYTVLGEGHTVEPRVIITHTACRPGEIVFERAGNAVTGARLEGRFTARDGDVYSITAARDGRVRITVAPAAAPPPAGAKKR